MLFSLSSHASFVSCSCCFMVLFVSSYSCSLLFRIIHGSFCFVLFIILLFHAPSHAPFVSCSFLFRLIHAPFCFVLFMLLLFHAPFLFRLIHVPFLLLFSLCLFCASSPCRSLSLSLLCVSNRAGPREAEHCTSSQRTCPGTGPRNVCLASGQQKGLPQNLSLYTSDCFLYRVRISIFT